VVVQQLSIVGPPAPSPWTCAACAPLLHNPPLRLSSYLLHSGPSASLHSQGRPCSEARRAAWAATSRQNVLGSHRPRRVRPCARPGAPGSPPRAPHDHAHQAWPHQQGRWQPEAAARAREQRRMAPGAVSAGAPAACAAASLARGGAPRRAPLPAAARAGLCSRRARRCCCRCCRRTRARRPARAARSGQAAGSCLAGVASGRSRDAAAALRRCGPGRSGARCARRAGQAGVPAGGRPRRSLDNCGFSVSASSPSSRPMLSRRRLPGRLQQGVC